MKRRTKIALYLFLFLFPIIHIVVSLFYLALVYVGGFKQEQIMTSNNQCITKYSDQVNDTIRNYYLIENLFFQKYHHYYPPVFLFNIYNNGIFFEYDSDSNQSNATVDISFDKKNKELTITHNIDSDNIVTKKNKVHGIKIKYITNELESEDD